MYVFYGLFTLFGFFAWWRISRRENAGPDQVAVQAA